MEHLKHLHGFAMQEVRLRSVILMDDKECVEIKFAWHVVIFGSEYACMSCSEAGCGFQLRLKVAAHLAGLAG